MRRAAASSLAILFSLLAPACGSSGALRGQAAPDTPPSLEVATPTLEPTTPTPEPATPTAEPTPEPTPEATRTPEPAGYNAVDCAFYAQAAVPVCQLSMVQCAGNQSTDVAAPAVAAAALAAECLAKKSPDCPDAAELLFWNSFWADLNGLNCPYYCSCADAEYVAFLECGGDSSDYL